MYSLGKDEYVGNYPALPFLGSDSLQQAISNVDVAVSVTRKNFGEQKLVIAQQQQAASPSLPTPSSPQSLG